MSQPAREALLRVADLAIQIPTPWGLVRPVTGVSFELRQGERIAIVGESGSGKSLTLRSMLRLIGHARYSGEIRFAGRDLLSLPDGEMRSIRGREIAYIFQDPLAALDPVRTVGSQLIEAGKCRGLSRRVARKEGMDLLKELGVREAVARFNDYPHEFSGGMRQRVMIAVALMGEPSVLLADEPTTALDVRLQAQILDLLWQTSVERGLAVILVSHDLGVVAGFAERVLVMYAGKIRESCAVDALFASPLHPYTQGLLKSIPSLMSYSWGSIGGMKGSSASTTSAANIGCAFSPRCPYVEDLCLRTAPPLEEHRTGHRVACHFTEKIPPHAHQLTHA